MRFVCKLIAVIVWGLACLGYGFLPARVAWWGGATTLGLFFYGLGDVLPEHLG